MALVQDVIARLRSIDHELPTSDGAAVFNRLYLTVTEQVAAGLAEPHVFRNPVFMEQLDVTFAGLWLEAYDAPGNAWPKAWAPLFESRQNRSLLPIQFALAGMNSHIAHDLPVAVVRTCQNLGASPEDAGIHEDYALIDVRRPHMEGHGRDLEGETGNEKHETENQTEAWLAGLGASPEDAGIHEDYEKVNELLAACESEIRRSFLSEAGQAADEHVGPVVHLISAWKIDKARDVAWVNAETLWALRDLGLLADRYRAALARTVGMASRCLLTPTLPS